ncbi:MAG: sigma-70 family RNA polymerase sigma factor [Myxococcota bacterium]
MGGSPWSDDALRDALALARRLARRWVVQREDAEDIAQEAVCRLVFQRRVESPPAWLAVVVRRLAWRAGHARRRELAALSQVRRQTAPRSKVSVAESRCELRALLDRASPHDRLLLRLDGLGYSDDEISRAIGCRASSVHTLLARARARLRRLSTP